MFVHTSVFSCADVKNCLIEASLRMIMKHDLTTLFICLSNESSVSRMTPRFLAESTNLMQDLFINIPFIQTSLSTEDCPMTSILFCLSSIEGNTHSSIQIHNSNSIEYYLLMHNLVV